MKDHIHFFYFISFLHLSSFCFVITKLFFRVPFSAMHFCNLVACSLKFSEFSARSYLSFFFISDFRQLLRTSFLFNFLFMFLVFNLLNLSFFWNSFKLRDLLSFIRFFKSLPRIWNSLSVSNRAWFSSPMHIFNKQTVTCKKEIF